MVARNPYRTAPGSEPPQLAGRAGELGSARLAIDMAASGEPPKPIVFTGLRGMGKTALLRRVVREIRAAAGIVVVAEADRRSHLDGSLRRELERQIADARNLPKRIHDAIARALERLPKLSYELPHDAGSFAVSGSHVPEPEDRDDLETLIDELSENLKRHGRFLAIAIDEIQESDPRDLLRCVRAVHATAGTDHPIAFIGAGLPSSSEVLKNVRTYTERWAFYRLDLLDRSATRDAVDIPARELNVTWTPDAIERLYEETAGYPYFVQEFASAAWTARSDNKITAATVDTVTPAVHAMFDESLYGRGFTSITPREAAYVLALVNLGPGAHHADAVSGLLDRASSEISSIRNQLVRKGIIYSPARGLVEFRLPLTERYVRRHGAAWIARARLQNNLAVLAPIA